MTINYQGHSCFLITLDDGTRWVTDPYDGSLCLDAPAVHADITTVSHSHFDHSYTQALLSAGTVLSNAGKYELNGATFELLPSFHDEVQGAKRGPNLVTICTANGKRICHLGDLGVLDDDTAAALHDIDVLLIPVGGVYTIDADAAADVVRRVAPKLTIPMHYKVPKLALGLARVEGFVNAVGGASYAHSSSVTLTDDLSGVVVLEPVRG